MGDRTDLPAGPTGWLDRGRQRLGNLLLNRLDRWSGPLPDAPTPAPAACRPTGVAFAGCGFVADFYAANLKLHPELKLIGVTDRDPARSARLAGRHACKAYPSLEALLADPEVEIVANLTNPHSHFEISRAALQCGKHVYSEKPLALDLAEAEQLVALADEQRLLLSAAPCSVLSPTAQALRDAIDRGDVGTVRLAYAELDDGAIHRMHPEQWASPAGTPWPWRDEFTVGCTIEHAAYHLTWLVNLFGSAHSVAALSSRLAPAKHPDLPPERSAADFSVACIRFESGVVARLTCSIVAPHDHSLRIVGDDGVLSIDECWHYRTPVRLRRSTPLARRAETYAWIGREGLAARLFGLSGRRSDLSPGASWRSRVRRHEMDYALGIAELAAALRHGRPSRLSAALALHVTEITLAIHQASEHGATVKLKTRCSDPA